MNEGVPGMSSPANLSSVPNLVHRGENQWMQFFDMLLAVPKPAIDSYKPWMSNFLKRASVPKRATSQQGSSGYLAKWDFLLFQRTKKDTVPRKYRVYLISSSLHRGFYSPNSGR